MDNIMCDAYSTRIYANQIIFNFTDMRSQFAIWWTSSKNKSVTLSRDWGGGGRVTVLKCNKL